MSESNKRDNPSVSYTKRGNIYVKPAELVRSKAGSDLIDTYSSSITVQTIRKEKKGKN